ncbi:MAG TPA: MBL fold metallo-hydrolase [Vicinamibacterales bacterium]|nr:MBL fold metallo-hydrolase [Vicinamibacterales bacterium]
MIKPLAAGLDYVDLLFLGRPDIIATAILRGADGVALIDPGPSTTIETLRLSLKHKGIALADVRQLLLTHIHLDHAGATGTLVRENPAIEVVVHERGAPHMADPAKLLASATRLYGEADMQRLWGEFLPVPRSNLRALQGGETLVAGGRELDVAYTPGHASHHVSYFDRASRVAFVGDTAGIRRGPGTYVMPPTPPPDIDLEIWRESEARILAWDPDTLFLTHFGPFHGARLQFQQLRENIEAWNRIVQRLIADPGLSEEARQQTFVDEAFRELRRSVGEQEAEQYGRAGRLDYSWQGLARYWRKRGISS